jgi:pyruvate,water dikinase
MPESFITFLDALNPNALAVFGGKAVNLARLHQLGVRIPAGFAISTTAFTRFLYQNMTPELFQRLTLPDLETALEEAALIQERAAISEVPDEVTAAIIAGYQKLASRIEEAPAGYAVRSSATVEDTETFSFAGQADSFLCVQDPDNIVEAVKKTWLSAFSPRAVIYLHSKGVPLQKVQMGVVVQEVVPADVSGVMFTANVVTSDPSQILIDATWGLGESIVSGKVNPDSFIIQKTPLKIVDRRLGSKKVYSTPYPTDRPECTMIQDTPEDKRRVFTLTDEALLEIAEAGLRIEQGLGAPQDIEWCLIGGELIILQTRPITTL